MISFIRKPDSQRLEAEQNRFARIREAADDQRKKSEAERALRVARQRDHPKT